MDENTKYIIASNLVLAYYTGRLTGRLPEEHLVTIESVFQLYQLFLKELEKNRGS